MQMVSKQLAKRWAESRHRREEEERRQRVMVITEFDAGDPEATMHAMAGEILEYRRAVGLLAKAIGWTGASAPFALIAPGPLPAAKRARVTGSDARSPEMPDVPPPVV
jgi:HAMP domain-containing protein